MPLLSALSRRFLTPRESADHIVDRLARTLTKGPAPRWRGSPIRAHCAHRARRAANPGGKGSLGFTDSEMKNRLGLAGRPVFQGELTDQRASLEKERHGGLGAQVSDRVPRSRRRTLRLSSRGSPSLRKRRTWHPSKTPRSTSPSMSAAAPHPSNPGYPGHVGQGQGPAGSGCSGPSTWGVLGSGYFRAPTALWGVAVGSD